MKTTEMSKDSKKLKRIQEEKDSMKLNFNKMNHQQRKVLLQLLTGGH